MYADNGFTNARCDVRTYIATELTPLPGFMVQLASFPSNREFNMMFVGKIMTAADPQACQALCQADTGTGDLECQSITFKPGLVQDNCFFNFFTQVDIITVGEASTFVSVPRNC